MFVLVVTRLWSRLDFCSAFINRVIHTSRYHLAVTNQSVSLSHHDFYVTQYHLVTTSDILFETLHVDKGSSVD